MTGFVRERRGRFSIDRRRKLPTLIPNTLILRALEQFLAERFAQRGGLLVDVGAGARPYGPVYDPYFERHLAYDLADTPHGGAALDDVAAADRLPLPDGVVDCVLCTEVLEHCPRPADVLAEFARVLRPGGFVFLTTPFLVGLHELPYDYFRYTPRALSLLAGDAGFDVVSITPRGGAAAVGLPFVQRPLILGLRALGKLLRVDLASPRNPLVYVLIVLPQELYLRFWRVPRDPEAARATTGYVCVLRRPS